MIDWKPKSNTIISQQIPDGLYHITVIDAKEENANSDGHKQIHLVLQPDNNDSLVHFWFPSEPYKTFSTEIIINKLCEISKCLGLKRGECNLNLWLHREGDVIVVNKKTPYGTFLPQVTKFIHDKKDIPEWAKTDIEQQLSMLL